MNYLFLISSLILVITGYIVFRIIVQSDYIKKGKLSFKSYSLEFIIFALHANSIYLFIPTRWPNMPKFPADPFMSIITYCLLFVGLFIVITAMTGLGFGRSMGQDRKQLKMNGLYKYSRNPQAIGYGLVLIACTLAYPSLYAFSWFLIYIALISMMIKSEEEFLIKMYGDEYHNYCHCVPRIIWFI